MKTLPQLTKEAQAAFTWFIRECDYAEPCICCGEWGRTRCGNRMARLMPATICHGVAIRSCGSTRTTVTSN